MSNNLTAKTSDGEDILYVDEMIGQGAMKDVYFTPDKKQVVCFYRTEQDETALERLNNIVGKYNPIKDPEGGHYWRDLFCWPTRVVYNDRLGIMAPTYQDHFFFDSGIAKGKEKEGKWFASAKLRCMLDPVEKGTWLSYFRINLLISRAVGKLHRMGLAHSDLSYKNVLVDPKGMHATIIDVDSLVVPGKYPPDVLGTRDFIAPEVLKTQMLDRDDSNRFLPSRTTDLHALAVLIYMYLLYRHPLDGGKIHDSDPQKDDLLSMGSQALFVEDPNDPSNRPNLKTVDKRCLPWADVNRIPYTVCGPYLKALFDQAFIDGLHKPQKRPTASQWEKALIKTIDLMQPCGNSKCEQKWFVFDNTTSPRCPFCGWKFKGKLPVLTFYTARRVGQFAPEQHQLMVYHNQYIYQWHTNSRIIPNEKLPESMKKPCAYFAFHQNRWVCVNQNLPEMRDLTTNKNIAPGSAVAIQDGQKLLLSNQVGGRLVYVQLVEA